MARLRKGDSNYDISLIPSDATDRPIGLMLQRPVKNGKQAPAQIGVDYLPSRPFEEKRWYWQNGPAGAGWSIETPLSASQGGCSHGENVWLRKDGSVMPAGKLTEVALPAAIAAATGGRIFDMFEWGTAQHAWFTTGKQWMIYVPNGVDTPQIGVDFGAGVETANAAIFSGTGNVRAYVSCYGTAGIKEYTGTTWNTGAAGTERARLATVYWVLGNALATGGAAGSGGTGGYRLLGTDPATPGFYHVAGDPKVSANWSAFTGVGDANYPIQNIVVANRTAWFGKSNGVHAVDGLGYAPNISKWFELALDHNNCGAIAYWEGAIWVAHQQGLVMVPISGDRQDVATFAQFGYQKSNNSGIYGRPRWLAPSPEGLYVGYYNEVTNISYIGSLQMVGSTPRWSMAECVIPDEEVTFIRHASPGGVPRLWIGTLDASDKMHLYWQDLPRTGDPEIDAEIGTSFRFATDWSVTGSRFNGGSSDENTFRRYTLESDGVGDANTVQWLISVDGGAFTDQGTATVSPTWSSTPTAGYVRGVSAQVKLVGHNADSVPIIIRSAEIKYTPHPRLTKVKTYPVVFGENIPLKNGHPDSRDPGVTLSRLESLQTDDPMDMIDEFGRTVEVLVEPGFSEQAVEGSDTNGYHVEGTLRVSITRQPAQWDIDLFDLVDFS